MLQLCPKPSSIFLAWPQLNFNPVPSVLRWPCVDLFSTNLQHVPSSLLFIPCAHLVYKRSTWILFPLRVIRCRLIVQEGPALTTSSTCHVFLQLSGSKRHLWHTHLHKDYRLRAAVVLCFGFCDHNTLAASCILSQNSPLLSLYLRDDRPAICAFFSQSSSVHMVPPSHPRHSLTLPWQLRCTITTCTHNNTHPPQGSWTVSPQQTTNWLSSDHTYRSNYIWASFFL